MKKLMLGILAFLGLLVLGLVAFITLKGNPDFDAATQNLVASKDSTVIARGRYLAYGPAHCASCHTPMDRKKDIDNGVEVPMSGGWELSIPPGTFRAANLTPDMETGIGNLTDAQLVRAMRYSINHRGKMMFPFMPFQEMSDEDVVALISFLRSQVPVKNEMKPTEFSFLGKALMAFGVAKPVFPAGTPPQSVKVDTSIEYGSYLANKVTNCVGCHTERDLKTGVELGPKFAGGLVFPADNYSEGYTFISPNLTPDMETGVMAKMTEQSFIDRFRKGRVYSGSQMPWGSFSRMNDLELKAIYRYIQSLAPVNRKIEKVAYAPGEKLPS
ncbi:MAG: c-type cytochrome [Bacteroidia bacterium]|nr:c-type cytochrome [Bacteroidia bacterium]